MRFARVIAGVAVSALGLVGAPAAHAATEITGSLCGFAGLYDPTGTIADPETLVVEIDGGPITAADPDNPMSDPTVWIACSIQVNHPTHAGPDAAHAVARGYGVAYLPPTLASFSAQPADDVVYLCTEVSVLRGDRRVSVYYDETSSEFIDDASAATCSSGSAPESLPREVSDALCAITAYVPEVYDEVCA